VPRDWSTQATYWYNVFVEMKWTNDAGDITGQSTHRADYYRYAWLGEQFVDSVCFDSTGPGID
jgi:hypothetical protein